MTRFIDAYDAAMFDLDGVVYLGPDAVVGSSGSIAALRGLGVKIGFVTNNAGRPAGVVVDHLNELGIECQLSDVVTSAQAISQVMARELPAGAKVLVCGAAGLAEEVAAVGLTVVRDHRDEPVAVVQGYDPDLDWKVLEQAGFAIQRGARWFGTNPDINRPTNLGMVPGAGAQIQALGTAVDAPITMAGKPFPPLLLETIKRLGAQRPVFVGDRLDTDIEGAYNVDIDSFMVFTGAHGKRDLATAIVQQRPTAIGHDLRDLLKPRREANWQGTRVACGQAVAEARDGIVVLTGPLGDVDQQLDALWAIVQLTWQDAALAAEQALSRLELLP